MALTDTLSHPARTRPFGSGLVTHVSRSDVHNFHKQNVGEIELVAGLGVKDDAHLGATVQHVVRVKEDPTKPNFRQVHLIHEELFAELAGRGFKVRAGEIGENITTRGLEFLKLPAATRLHIGTSAIVEVTGLRNPCRQLDRFQPGLMAALLDRDSDGNLIRKSGIMSIVIQGGIVRPGDAIEIELPPHPHQPMNRV
ncbi:MAG: MOSC domain-containing protein [Alphaproteobacteria bacterium]|nr:MOSC domain-containing protein [Alphaproteobacteria bacterium]